jgi:hypothetical protein
MDRTKQDARQLSACLLGVVTINFSYPVPFVAGPFVAGPFVAGPFVAGPFVAGPFVAGPFVAGPFVAGPFVAECFVGAAANVSLSICLAQELWWWSADGGLRTGYPLSI